MTIKKYADTSWSR